MVEKGSTSSQYMITTVGPRIFEGEEQWAQPLLLRVMLTVNGSKTADQCEQESKIQFAGF